MKRQTALWVEKAEEDIRVARNEASLPNPARDAVCFHCQQSAEKYLKALLQELGEPIPKIHDLEDLLDLLLPHDPALKPLRRGLGSLTRYAVEYRYPGARANTREMHSALRNAEHVRAKLRTRLGLPA